MVLPTAYLTSGKNMSAILAAIAKAQAPPRFTQKFLEGLGYPSSSDRLTINILKSLGFLSDTGEPTERYHRYLDTSQSKRVLAEGIRVAYSDLFQINAAAQEMTRADLKNKMKTLSQGQHSETVLDKMALTFKTLADIADWSDSVAPSGNSPRVVNGDSSEVNRPSDRPISAIGEPKAIGVSGLVYNLNLHLPESRDAAVYDALFRSLREHLL